MYIRDQHAVAVRVFRWLVFLLAAGYVIRHLIFTADYSLPGGPFRHLTFWGLMFSFAAASRMLALTEGRTHRDWSTLVGVTAVINLLVVFLYWRLWFTDPALVNSGGPNLWYDEYYLHLLGPALQWFDALFVFGAFRRVLPALGGLAPAVLGYVAWIELFVGRFNDFPRGSVTAGLPYPFLNDMEIVARAGFYGTTSVTALAFLGGFWGLATLARRLFGSS